MLKDKYISFYKNVYDTFILIMVITGSIVLGLLCALLLFAILTVYL